MRLGVNVLVLYLEATLDAFSNWFRDYSRQMSHAHPLPPDLKFLFLSAAKVEFNQAIGECRLVMPGIFQFHQHAPETHPEALMLTVQPVGRGQTIVVRVNCSDPAFESYRQQVVAGIRAAWPDATPVQLRASNQESDGVSVQVRLTGTLDDFERELRHFVANYRAAEVNSVTLQTGGSWSTAERRSIHPDQQSDGSIERSWIVYIHLILEDRMFRSIRDILIHIKATPLGGQYPLLLELGFAPPLFREGFEFSKIFLTHCQGLWNAIPADFAYLTQSLKAQPAAKSEWTIWPGLPQPTSEMVAVIEAPQPPAASTPSTPAAVRENTTITVAVEPETAPAQPVALAWEKITDHMWDRKALELWWKGYSCPEIGEVIRQSPKTVLNRLCTLRKIYGMDIIPTDKQRQKRDRGL